MEEVNTGTQLQRGGKHSPPRSDSGRDTNNSNNSSHNTNHNQSWLESSALITPPLSPKFYYPLSAIGNTIAVTLPTTDMDASFNHNNIHNNNTNNNNISSNNNVSGNSINTNARSDVQLLLSRLEPDAPQVIAERDSMFIDIIHDAAREEQQHRQSHRSRAAHFAIATMLQGAQP